MILDVGGVRYSCAPFNGWYMGIEIGKGQRRGREGGREGEREREKREGRKLKESEREKREHEKSGQNESVTCQKSTKSQPYRFVGVYSHYYNIRKGPW